MEGARVMNGLEAIELMQQGKMVVCKHGDDVVINKIIDGSGYE